MRKLLLCALFPSLAFAAEQFSCPARFPSEDIVLATPKPKASEGRILSGSLLVGGGMAIGPTALRGDLRGRDRETKGGWESEYAFNRNEEPPEKWAFCSYAGGDLRWYRRVADDATKCTISVKRRKGRDQVTVRVECS
ncbi:STY0301 family protein [Massilia sp. MS-15]|uniref:STY0301 family protein n=1 Tax=Massilia sp. MS-15 TaxID=2878200 RepID=UPI0035A66E9F